MSLTKYKNWSHSDNFKFLSVWHEMRHSLKTNHANKAEVYFAFKTKLKAIGVERSVCQIKKKISNFKEGFKKFTPCDASTPSSWPYYDRVAEILGVKPQQELIVSDHALDSWPLATSSGLILSSQSSLGISSKMFKQELPERSWNNSLTVNVSSDNDTSVGEDVSQHHSPIGGNSSTHVNLSCDSQPIFQSIHSSTKISSRPDRSKDEESDCSERPQQPRKKARSCQSLNTLCIESSSDDNSESSFITSKKLMRSDRTNISISDQKLLETYKRLLDESKRQCEEYRDKYMEQLNETGKYVNQLMDANKKIVELNKYIELTKRKQLCVNCLKECKH